MNLFATQVQDGQPIGCPYIFGLGDNQFLKYDTFQVGVGGFVSVQLVELPPENKKRLPNMRVFQSGRADLDRRPLRPERSALAGLSHAPNKQAGIITVRLQFDKPFAV